MHRQKKGQILTESRRTSKDSQCVCPCQTWCMYAPGTCHTWTTRTESVSASSTAAPYHPANRIMSTKADRHVTTKNRQVDTHSRKDPGSRRTSIRSRAVSLPCSTSLCEPSPARSRRHQRQPHESTEDHPTSRHPHILWNWKSGDSRHTAARNCHAQRWRTHERARERAFSAATFADERLN